MQQFSELEFEGKDNSVSYNFGSLDFQRKNLNKPTNTVYSDIAISWKPCLRYIEVWPIVISKNVMLHSAFGLIVEDVQVKGLNKIRGLGPSSISVDLHIWGVSKKRHLRPKTSATKTSTTKTLKLKTSKTDTS